MIKAIAYLSNSIFCFEQLQLVQKSFARLLYDDFLRNARLLFVFFIPLGIMTSSFQKFYLHCACTWGLIISASICSSIDEAAKEKLGPFSTLSGDESYQSRDLEKVL